MPRRKRPQPARSHPDLAAQARADLQERQNLPTGSRRLRRKLREHTSQPPALTGGDVDAAWEYTRAAGEETPGASVPTPDQDVVDEIGKAVGLTCNDDEPLGFDRKVLSRDRHRWELNPASAETELNEGDDAWEAEDDEEELLEEYTEEESA